MKHRDLVLVPADRVEVELDGIIFGTPEAPEIQTEDVKIPESLASLADILRAESKLLALHDHPQLTKPTVLEAYGHDVNLLSLRMKELSECVRQAIRCSIVVGGDRQLTPEDREARAQK